MDVKKIATALASGKPKAMREAAKAVHEERLALAQAVANANRDFTSEEDRRDGELKSIYDTLIQAAVDAESAFQNAPIGSRQRLGNDALPGEAGSATGTTFRDESGLVLRAYRPSDRFADPGIDGEVGDSIRNLAVGGNFSNASFGGDPESGGYLLPPAYTGRLIDLARAASVVSRAGAQTVKMPAGGLRLVTVESDPVPRWRHETVAVEASNPLFGQLNLTAKALAVVIPVSVELLEDAGNAGVVLEALVATAIGQEVDRAALLGSGAGAEPRGILETPGVNTLTNVGAPTDYSDLSEAITEIYEANYPGEPEGLSVVCHPTIGGIYDGLTSTVDGQPLRATPRVEKLRRFETTKLDVSQAVLGDFTQTVIAVRTDLRVRWLDAGSVVDSAGTNWNAASQLMKLLVVYARLDVGVLRPSWFTTLSGITTS